MDSRPLTRTPPVARACSCDGEGVDDEGDLSGGVVLAGVVHQQRRPVLARAVPFEQLPTGRRIGGLPGESASINAPLAALLGHVEQRVPHLRGLHT